MPSPANVFIYCDICNLLSDSIIIQLPIILSNSASFWTTEEVDLGEDWKDWQKLKVCYITYSLLYLRSHLQYQITRQPKIGIVSFNAEYRFAQIQLKSIYANSTFSVKIISLVYRSTV